MYLAIDPGEHAGWALLDGDVRIFACGIGECPRLEDVPAVVLCEKPTIYPYSKASPANIITLAITAGKLVGPWERRGSRIEWVEPRTWKGQIDKQKHHAWMLHTLPAVESVIVSECLKGIRPKAREDAMDAVGLAMYGRKMRVFL